MSQYDLFIFQGAGVGGDKKITMALTPEQQCTGVQKVAQTFAKLFLTDKGSVASDTTMGTDFMPTLRSGAIRDEPTLQAAFQSAVIDVLNYISLNTDTIPPSDEQLTDATLVSWDLQPGRLSIKVSLTTAAGTSVVYVLPINTGITI